MIFSAGPVRFSATHRIQVLWVADATLSSRKHVIAKSFPSGSRSLLIVGNLKMLQSSASVGGEEETVPHVNLDRLTEHSASSYNHFREESPMRRRLVDQYARHVSWRW